MNSRIAAGFDFISPVYDHLARLIIGRDIVNSQLHFLNAFRKCNHLLILGGGSGWILDPLLKACPDIQIDYIDLSPKMLKTAKANSGTRIQVNFILGTENDIPHRLYDGVITNFYLDMFEKQTLEKMIEKIKGSMINSGSWMITDFVNESRGSKVMLWFMYRFFRIIARIEATHLPDWPTEMIHADFTLLDSQTFQHGFIKSNVYRFTTQSS